MRLMYAVIMIAAFLTGCASTDWSSDTPTKANSRSSRAARVNLKNQSVSKVYAPSDNLWLRIRDGFQMEPMNTPQEIEQVRWLSSRPDYVNRSMTRSSRYLFLHCARSQCTKHANRNCFATFCGKCICY